MRPAGSITIMASGAVSKIERKCASRSDKLCRAVRLDTCAHSPPIEAMTPRARKRYGAL
jgi:hypothetical protein